MAFPYWGEGLMQWFGHRSRYIFAVLASIQMLQFMIPLNDAATLALFFPLISGYTICIITARQHDIGLCAECFHAELVIDHEAAIQRHRYALKFYHLRYGIKVSVSISIGSAIAFLVFPQNHGIIAVTLAGSTILPTIYVGYVAMVHRRLTRWCPYCQWGEGGDDDGPPEPSPEPTGSNIKVHDAP